ncbi:MAG: bifunctional folylpolyglutamate synthase/dihydrofolate synthase, partial [Wujia sp.]
MRYDEAVKFIEDTPRFVDGGTKRNKSGNENLAMVMAQLGNPELRHPAIHIAGTNGKGSTVRMTMCILCNMGYSVGTFISPHLIKLNERISISSLCNDGKSIATKDITDEAFVCCFERVMKAVEQVVDCGGGYLSYFEMLFAIAAVYYENKSVDYVIYETGLGGRLDATNLITPVITAITSIGLDHTAYLGDTIEQIAAEKAGIIKESVPIVYNTGEKI